MVLLLQAPLFALFFLTAFSPLRLSQGIPPPLINLAGTHHLRRRCWLPARLSADRLAGRTQFSVLLVGSVAKWFLALKVLITIAITISCRMSLLLLEAARILAQVTLSGRRYGPIISMAKPLLLENPKWRLTIIWRYRRLWEAIPAPVLTWVTCFRFIRCWPNLRRRRGLPPPTVWMFNRIKLWLGRGGRKMKSDGITAAGGRLVAGRRRSSSHLKMWLIWIVRRMIVALMVQKAWIWHWVSKEVYAVFFSFLFFFMSFFFLLFFFSFLPFGRNDGEGGLSTMMFVFH